MAIQKDTVSIPLLKGINTKVDPNQEQVGQLTVLKNAKFTKIGSIAKRNGFGVLTKEFTTISTASVDNELLSNLIDPLAVRGSGDDPVIITKQQVGSYRKADKKTYEYGAYTPYNYTTFPMTNDDYLQVNSQSVVFGDLVISLHTKTISGSLLTYVNLYDISNPSPAPILTNMPLRLNMTGTAYPNSSDGGSTYGAFSLTNAQSANGRLLVHRNKVYIFVTDSSGNLFYKVCDPYDYRTIINEAMTADTGGEDGGWLPVYGGALNNTYNVYDIEEDTEGVVIAMTKTSGTANTLARKYGDQPYLAWHDSMTWTHTSTALGLYRVKGSAPSNNNNAALDDDLCLVSVADNLITVTAINQHYTTNWQWTKTLTAGINGARFVSLVANDNLYTYPSTIDSSTTNATNIYFDIFTQYRRSGDPTLATVDHIPIYDNTSGTRAAAYLTTNNFDSGTTDDVRSGDWSTITFSSLEPWITDYVTCWEFIPDNTSYSTPLAEVVIEDYRLGVGIAGRAFQVKWGQDEQRHWDERTVPWNNKTGQWVQPFSYESELSSSFYFLSLAGPYNNFNPAGLTNADTGIDIYSKWSGILAYGIGGGDLETGTGGVPSLSKVDYYNRNGSSSVIFPYTVQSRVTTEDVSSEAAAYTAFYNTESATMCKINYDPGIPNQSKEIADSLFIPGGMVQKYQSGTFEEAGFIGAPQRLYLYLGGATAMTEVSTASPTFAKGNIYNYVAVFSKRDAYGRVYKSSLSKQLQVTITNTSTNTGYEGINLLVPMNTVTNESDYCNIEVYRTTNNGTVFYKVSGQNSALNNPYLVNDPKKIFIAFRDTITDDDLTNNELLYTTGGTLENTPPPSCSIMETYKNIVFMAGLENPYAIQYTKEVGYNTALDFNDTLLLETPTIGGPITALKGMDDKFFIFKQTSVYFVAGGQNNFTSYLRTKSGQVTDIELPILSADIGCINKNSCVLTPIGIMFKSNRGIYLINRANLTLEYIGAPVQEFNHLDITDATLYAKVGEVRFITYKNDTLVYNYERDVWYTFSNNSGMSQTVINDEFYYVSDANTVLKEIEGVYEDAGTPIPVVMETGWMSFGKVQGFQRVYRMLMLGHYKSNHMVKIKVAYDYDDTWEDEYLIQMTDSTQPEKNDQKVGSLQWSGDPQELKQEQSDGTSIVPTNLKASDLFSTLTYGTPRTQYLPNTPMNSPLGTESGIYDASFGDPTLKFSQQGATGAHYNYTFGSIDIGTNYPNSNARARAQGFGSSNAMQYQFRINFKKQKCEAIKISIETYQYEDQVGEAASFSNLSFLVGLKGGDYRIRQSRVKGTDGVT
tara:strand:- start:4296 stop:8246 length:3951 start_codon:yes stop_codon:yes gene_type:complete